MRIVGELDLGAAVMLRGPRDDVPDVMQAMDVYTSSSRGEAFPSVLGEAMASALPCAATDVGYSALILSDTGLVVPSQDPAGLSSAWCRLIETGEPARRQMGERARERIQALFSLETVAERYAALYEDCLKSPAA